jgi:hypothetical protein
MNKDTGRGRGWPRPTKVLAATMAGTALLVAACGAGGSSPAKGSKNYQKALAYEQCMRTNGEPGWPGPTSQGTFVLSQADINSTQYNSASSVCQHLQPAGAYLQQSAAQQQKLLNQGLKFAACMHAHGLPNFPDPSTQSGHVGGFKKTDFDPNSPLFRSAMAFCHGRI